MQRMLIVTGLVACLGLTACEKEEAAAPPPAKKSMARQDQLAAGEELVQSVTTGTIERGSRVGMVSLKATGIVPSPGYTRPYFLPRIYPARPSDGVYEVDVVAARPTAATPPAPTEVKIEGAWGKYADDRVKGVKFMTKTNSLVAMLPPAEAAKKP